jgi:ribosomal protein L7/L12
MDKKNILARLEMLVELCEKTEPKVPSDVYLFSGQLLAAQEMVKRVTDAPLGADKNEQLEIMREANKIWKMRNKWDKEGVNGNLEEIEMVEAIEDFIAQGQKINAIKLYRTDMERIFGQRVTLREAKEYIDQIAVDMKRRGILK